MGLWGIVTESRAHTLIHVRDLTTEELRRLRDCEQRLNLFAESSPMEVAAGLFADFDQAQNHAATTHSSSAISHSVSLAKRTAEQLLGLRELWRASLVEAGMEASRCTSLTQENEIAATLKKLETALAENSVSWGVKESSLVANMPDGSLVVQEDLARALKSAERLTLSLVVDLRDELDEACLYVRRLAAEVLLGDPVVMRGPGVDSISPSPLPLGPAAHVQRLKLMADRLTRQPQGRSAERPSRSARSDGYAAGSTSSAEGETPLADDVAPPKPTRKSPAPLPPASVTLEFLVDQFGRGLEDLLTAWSASVSVQDLVKDQQRLQAITAAIGQALLRESGAEGNTVVLPQFPPQVDVLANLDLADPKVRASWTWLGRLLLMQELASLVGQVAAPRGIEFVSGRVTKLSFRPGLIQQANELAKALSSCLADDPTNARAENLRLAERAFANGMPEAALLYGLYAIGDEVDDTLRNRAWELLSKVATEDAAPRGCIVPFARFLSDLASQGLGSSY